MKPLQIMKNWSIKTYGSCCLQISYYMHANVAVIYIHTAGPRKAAQQFAIMKRPDVCSDVTVMTPVVTQARVRMCYYTNRSQNLTDIGRFTPTSIDPTLCTHIIYASAHISADGTSLITTKPNDTGHWL